MIAVGTEHRNPVSGETLRFLRVDHDRVTVEIWAYPGFPVPPRHVHPRSAEPFEVLDGALSINAGSARRILEVGDAMTAAAGVPHGYAVVGSSPARFLVDLAPPGEMASFFSRIYRLAETGPVNRRGQPPPTPSKSPNENDPATEGKAAGT